MNTEIDIAALTLEQKAALVSGAGFWSSAALPEVGIEKIEFGDGPHGVRRQTQGTDHLGIYHSEPATCFPPAVAVGSSWSTEVAAAIGTALASEARALGVDVLLGPGVNIKRTPLGGRNFEYYAEDPTLSGVLATAYITALQGAGVGASVKHFAANDQETDRMLISADVDERTLREVHLSAFERVVQDAAPATVMCSYNKVNGVYASENHWLLTDVLRGEWRYSGAVISDWGAVRDRPASLAAGLDLSMPGPADLHVTAVVDAVRDGSIDEADLDVAAGRIASLSRAAKRIPGAFDPAAHHELAQRLAAECAVLLKNSDGVLPLARSERILVVGEFAFEPRFQGGGSSHVNATQVDVPVTEIEAHAVAIGATVNYARGFSTTDADDSVLLAEAVEAASTADTVIVFAGLPESEESEGFDRAHISLPVDQIRLITSIAATDAKTVVVLANGGIVSLEGWHDGADAILEGFLLGQGGGRAIADLLFGAENPSGRLAETIPLRLEHTPTYLSFPGEQGHVRYTEGVMVGYRHYETVGAPVRYPFGHGLSYTRFEVGDLETRATASDEIEVTVTVSNAGERAGKHVVQVYVATDAGPVRRPRRFLGAFAKVELQAGESSRVRLALDRRAFRYWDITRSQWVVSPGAYTIEVAENASTVLLAHDVELDGDDLGSTLSLQSNVSEWFAHPTAGPALLAKMAPIVAASGGGELTENGDAMALIGSLPMVQMLNLMGGAISEDWLVGQLAEPVGS